VVAEWVTELAERLQRPEDELRARGLSAYDFSSSRAVEIRFVDGSHAKFRYAFAIVSKSKERVAVFTEHCGYLEFPLTPELEVIEISENYYRHE
jgi:hypothetical protein